MKVRKRRRVFHSQRLLPLVLLTAMIGGFIFSGWDRALAAERDYTVAVYTSGLPFDAKGQDGELSGFDVDLWKEIALKLGIKYHFREMAHFPEVLEAVSNGEADFGLAAISITSERSRSMVFSQPYFVAGQGILVNARRGHTVLALLEVLWSPVIFSAIALVLILIVVYGHLLWLAERGRNPLVSSSYVPGVFEAMWCAFAIKTTIGFGDLVPRRWLARLISIPIWLTGIFLVSIISAQLISEFVAERVKMGGSISSYHDLRKKKVVVLGGTTGLEVVKGLSPRRIVEVNRIEKGYKKLFDHEADALVYDYPFLAYAADTMRDQGYEVKVVGDPFGEEFYGIAMSQPLVEEDPGMVRKINMTILELRDRGYLEGLKHRWIGSLDAG